MSNRPDYLYCPECGNYLMCGTGDCINCSCGFIQPSKRPNAENQD